MDTFKEKEGFEEFEKHGVGNADNLESFITVGANDQIYLSVGFMDELSQSIGFDPEWANLYFNNEKDFLGIEFLKEKDSNSYMVINNSDSNNRTISGMAVKEEYEIKRQRYYDIDIENNLVTVQVERQ